jgi:hypothetical protein
MRNRYQFGGYKKREEPVLEPRQPHLEIVTRQDLIDLKTDLLEAMKNLRPAEEEPSKEKVQKRFLKTGDLMKMLGLSRNTVNDLRTSKVLPAVRVHGIYLFDIQDVENFIKENKR